MTKGDLVSSASKPISFSFAGCGFLGLYHVGVASCLREYAPINRNTKIGGASAGALAAMALACDLPLGESTSEILSVAIKARARALGPFHPSFDVNRIIYESLVKTLPDDAHLKANGRLFISVTRISDGKNVIINKFKSKEELIKAIQCSCFIPLWSGLLPPKFNGITYIDGGCSDNLPIIDDNTVTISPFSGESDICPQDDTYNLFQFNLVNTSIALTPANFYRITRILFPAHPEVLSKMCQQGFDDALRYLQRNNKISCTRCLAIHFTLEKEDTTAAEDEQLSLFEKRVLKRIEKHMSKAGSGSSSGHSEKSGGGHLHSENCRDCEYRRQIAGFDSLPESVVQAIQEACDQVNKGIINWLFRHKPMKLLSILSIPYLLPIDITIVLFSKLIERLPDIKRELRNSLLRLVSFLRSLLVKMESNRYFYSAKFSCQLDLKEFNYAKEAESLTTSSDLARKISSTSSHSTRKKSSVVAAAAVSTPTSPATSLNVSPASTIGRGSGATKASPSRGVEKANSFSGRKNSEYRYYGGSSEAVMQKSMESVLIPSSLDQQPQQQSSPLLSRAESLSKSERLRKTSYAGREFGYHSSGLSPNSSFNRGAAAAARQQYGRRRSMIEIGNQGQASGTASMKVHHSMKQLPPERVISQLNFDFKLDMKHSTNGTTTAAAAGGSDKSVSVSDISSHYHDSVDGGGSPGVHSHQHHAHHLLDTSSNSLNSLNNENVGGGQRHSSFSSSSGNLHNLALPANPKVLDIDLADIDQSNAIEIANRALDWEKEFLEKCREGAASAAAAAASAVGGGSGGASQEEEAAAAAEQAGNFEQIFEITRKQDAALAYYYTDPVTDKVKFTELFNITNIDLEKEGLLEGPGGDSDLEEGEDYLGDYHYVADEVTAAAGLTAADHSKDDADDEYDEDDEDEDEHQKTILAKGNLPSYYQQQQPMDTYNDSDDGLIETTPPASHASVKSSLSSLHSVSSSQAAEGKAPLSSPSKRQRKKSVLVD